MPKSQPLPLTPPLPEPRVVAVRPAPACAAGLPQADLDAAARLAAQLCAAPVAFIAASDPAEGSADAPPALKASAG
ncbi:MAG TPA: sporulation protein, partial [Burkholderiaceae bacterium]|nr:sporulation protein [Burkholderiaceae bacterium]